MRDRRHKRYRPSTHSLSSGQVLMRDYAFTEAHAVADEMADALGLDMLEKALAPMP